MNDGINPYESPKSAPEPHDAMLAALRSGFRSFFQTLVVMAPITGYFVYSSYEIKPNGAVIHDKADDLLFVLMGLMGAVVGGAIGFIVEYRRRLPE